MHSEHFGFYTKQATDTEKNHSQNQFIWYFKLNLLKNQRLNGQG